MSSSLRATLFSRALVGETAGQLASRYALSFEVLAEANRLSASTDVPGDRLLAVPWAAFKGDADTTALGKVVLKGERAVLDALKAGLQSTQAPVRITGTPFQWDFAALDTVVSFTVSDDALVLTTDEGVGAVERLASSDGEGVTAACRAVARLCQTLEQALKDHRAR